MPVALAAAAFLFEDALKTVLVIVGIIPVLVTCGAFVYFTIVNPEKLQSEDYQVKHEAIQVLQIKSDRIDVSPTSLNEIAGTVAKQLQSVSEVDAND